MKRYQVELVCTTYVMFEVEANNEAEAEDKAWVALENSHGEHSYGEWDVNLIEEIE